MTNPPIDLGAKLICLSCGWSLVIHSYIMYENSVIEIKIAPCLKCLETIKNLKTNSIEKTDAK